MIAELLFRFQKPLCGLKDHSFPQTPDGGLLRGRQRHAESEFATLSLGRTDNLKIYLSTAPKAAGADGSSLILVLRLGFTILQNDFIDTSESILYF